jgi:hypothetical protein
MTPTISDTQLMARTAIFFPPIDFFIVAPS